MEQKRDAEGNGTSWTAILANESSSILEIHFLVHSSRPYRVYTSTSVLRIFCIAFDIIYENFDVAGNLWNENKSNCQLYWKSCLLVEITRSLNFILLYVAYSTNDRWPIYKQKYYVWPSFGAIKRKIWSRNTPIDGGWRKRPLDSPYWTTQARRSFADFRPDW